LALAESEGSKRKEAPNEGPRPARTGIRLDALRARGATPLSCLARDRNEAA
jgi:hypothetical protein